MRKLHDGTQVSLDAPVKLTQNGYKLLSPAEVLQKDSDAATLEVRKLEAVIKDKIYKLEAEVTPRRIREAILNTDNSWLANQDSLIAIERNKL